MRTALGDRRPGRHLLIPTLVLVVAATARPGSSQPVERLDINQVAAPKSLQVGRMATAGPLVFFLGDDAANGAELWRSDGTPPGTLLVRDIAPGTSDMEIQEPTAVGDILYFMASPAPLQPASFQTGLWRSDGTNAGTYAVPGTPTLYPRDLTAAGSTLYFFTYVTDRWALAKANADGTSIVHVFLPETWPAELTAAGDLLLFTLTGPDGREPWRSDGTDAGTALVVETCPGPCGNAARLTASGSRVFFVAEDGTSGSELWVSDGTAAGTRRVRDITPGAGSTSLDWLTDVGGTLFFTVGSPVGVVWKSDGTEVGTVPVAGAEARGLASLGSTLLFLDMGTRLWRTDGTQAGTFELPSPCTSCVSIAQGLIQPAGGLGYLFVHHAVGQPVEMWRSDGTVTGTFPAAQFEAIGLYPDSRGAGPQGYYFMAATAGNGFELWRTDGTGAGTVRLTTTSGSPSNPSNLARAGGRLLFNASDGMTSLRTWTSEGTAATTDSLVAPGSALLEAWTPFQGGLLFSQATNFTPLWKSDGTEAGTSVVTQLGRVREMAAFGNRAILFDSVQGLMRTDGTAFGTQPVFPLFPPPPEISVRDLVATGTLAFFSEGTSELWRTDGTPEGSLQLSNRDIRDLTPVGERVFFVSSQVGTGSELFVSDGTLAGTRLVKDINPGDNDSAVRSLREAAGRVYFVADDGSTGPELWRTDGSDSGTVRVADIRPGREGSQPVYLTSVGAWLYFVADDGTHGYELWRTDGTAAGTQLVSDIEPGPGSPFPNALSLGRDASLGSSGVALLFAAYQPQTGLELWTSDGTAAGTHLLQDVSPGPPSSSPEMFSTAGSRTYFRADDGTGLELWTVAGPSTVTLQDASVVEGNAGTSVATFRAILSSPSATTVTVSFATADGTAAAGSDYVPRAGTLTFAPGTQGPLSIDVTVLGDLQDEQDEWFRLDLTGASGAALPDQTALGTVRDDDAPRFTVSGGSFPEGSTAPFVVTLHTADGGPTSDAKELWYQTIGGTAHGESDYVSVFGTLTFPSGSADGSSQTVSVILSDDPNDEPDEFFDLRVQPEEEAQTTGVTGRVLIIDNDGPESSAKGDLTHGTMLRADLRAQSSQQPDRDWFMLQQAPFSSYEIVVDEVSADASPLLLRRMSSDGYTVVDEGVPVGAGTAVGMTWRNDSESTLSQQHISIESGGCLTDCGADDTYRVRFYDTTAFLSRVATRIPLRTVLLLQNRTDRTVHGKVWFWSAMPAHIPGGLPFTMAPRGLWTFDLTPYLLDFSGSATITHDAGYGGLAGKSVTFDLANGFTFDTPLTYRPR